MYDLVKRFPESSIFGNGVGRRTVDSNYWNAAVSCFILASP